ncbi:MAG: FG-GAP repeat domain-containing protein, partial [Planctomycetota bacterium]
MLSLRLLPLPGNAELAGASAGSFSGTAVAAETIDINHDGFDDLALAVSFGPGQSGLIQILLNDGAGNLGGTSVLETIPAQPTCLAVGDVDGDGNEDVAVGLASDLSARVYRDDGQGGLTPGTVISGLPSTPTSVIVIPPPSASQLIGGASVGVGLSGSKLRIYQNTTLQQEFTMAGTVETVRGGNTGGTQGKDIVTGGSKSASINMMPVAETGFVQVLRRQTNGQYAIVQSMYIAAKPKAMDVADLDGDGLDDIVTANAEPVLPAAGSALPVLSIFRNTGGTFGGGVPYQPSGASSGLSVSLVDADSDGDRDIVSVHRRVGTDSEAALLRVDTLGAGTPISIGQTTVLDAENPILSARGNLDNSGGDDVYLVDGGGGTNLTGSPEAK